MPTEIVELFGHRPDDSSFSAKLARDSKHCPFLEEACTKTFNDGVISGVCSLKPVTSGPVICCPNRLYAGHYRVLADVAQLAFGTSVVLCKPATARLTQVRKNQTKVVVFGKRWGQELPLPRPSGIGAFYVDWVLAAVDSNNGLKQFVPVEVQSIDTTGNYRDEQRTYMNGRTPTTRSTAGFNWENVNKRILPQLIYKGHVLRRERLCTKGLFFICPVPVYDRVLARLGNTLHAYPMQSGAITFVTYDLGPAVGDGRLRELDQQAVFTTTIDQVATAFTSPTHLPPSNVYENAIVNSLHDL